ncbi:MAG TPA: DinB family protein, partial [Chloroflexia bacterium]
MDFIATARRQMLAGQLQDGRERLVNSYAGLTDEEMLEPGVAGDWSVRDVLAHVAGWDRAQTEAYRLMLRGERPALLDLDEEGNEAFNLETHERMKDLSMQEVITELFAAREEMVEVLREVDNVALCGAGANRRHANPAPAP